jgi:hypothetical protein
MATLAVRSLIVRVSALRVSVLSASLTCLAFSGPFVSGRAARPNSTDSNLTAHEWGTFTSIAGRDGHAMRWFPLNGSDLPRFVEHFRTADLKVGLSGTIRMETPVLYFYSPSETTVSVKVRFSQGVISEWYPHASHIEPNPKAALDGEALFNRRAGREQDGSIAWDSVTIAPGLAASLPRGDPRDEKDGGNQYYAARETSSAPLLVRTGSGIQQEKFLFYRGVSIFPVPIAAQAAPDGKISVKNLGTDEIPSVILFERRGDKVGYRLGGAVQKQAALDPPELNSTVESLGRDLEGMLITQGLGPDEASAMVETWRQSWFEEGTRLLYIVPPHFVDTVLPLSIKPQPGRIVRVFVGRLELITPATGRELEKIITTHDIDGILRYGRFLEPIMEELKADNPARAAELDEDLSKTYSSAPPKSPAR